MPVPSHHCGPEKEVRPQFFVSGADLRRKRRRIIVDDTAPARAARVCLSEDDYLSSFEGEIRRQDYFNFHGITPSGLPLLEQGQFVMSQRLGELAFSPSGEAPRDGNCMMHSLNESERRPSGLCYVSTRLSVENL